MFKKVVLEAFNKAEDEILGNSTKTSLSENLSECLMEEYKFSVSGKTLRKLFDEAKEATEKQDIQTKLKLIDHLCKYLGYTNYKDYVAAHVDELGVKRKGLVGFLAKNKVILTISLITIIVVFTMTTINKQRWMMWDGTCYQEVDFNVEQFEHGLLKLYKEERIKNFCKLEPDCNTEFFTNTGLVNVWYGKNLEGEYEYFTSYGKHPQTGKGLKDITEYMIKTHICDTFD